MENPFLLKKVLASSALHAGVVLALSFFLGVSAVHAQTAPSQTSQPVVVATVNIFNAKIVSQQRNVFTVSFDLSNREGAQPGVRYAVQMVGSDGHTVVDEKIYPEVVNLDRHTDYLKKIDYTAPSYLAGKYRLMLVSRNENGLPLARAFAGEVVLTGDNQYLEILAPTCFLQVAGEKSNAKYTLDQGVDIAPSETLNLTCAIENHSKYDLVLKSSFATFYRTTFGKQVEDNKQAQESVGIKAGEKKIFTAPLPKALAPQAYDVKLSLSNEQNVASNFLAVHYVLRGEGATIQNLVLDNTVYQKGNLAKATIFWSGSADNFPNSRAGRANSTEGMMATVRIVDEKGNACGNDSKVKIDSLHPKQTIPFAVTRTCITPKVTVTLSNSAGAVLASSSFEFTPPVAPPVSSGKQGFPTTIWIVVLIILLIVTYFLFRMRRAGTPPIALFFLLLAPAVFGGLPQEAKADTFTQNVWLESAGGWHAGYGIEFTVNLDKSTYVPGETISASGWANVTSCGNSLTGGLLATINGVTKDVFVSTFNISTYQIDATRQSNTFSAPTVSGTYNAGFFAKLDVPSAGPGVGSFFCLTNVLISQPDPYGPRNYECPGGAITSHFLSADPHNIPYTVSNPNPPSVSLQFQ